MRNIPSIDKVGIGLAVLLILCFFPMPYGYYILIRFLSMIVFVLYAIISLKKQQITLSIICGSIALLFQPFMKIALGRGLWNIVDVVSAAFLLWIVYNNKSK